MLRWIVHTQPELHYTAKAIIQKRHICHALKPQKVRLKMPACLGQTGVKGLRPLAGFGAAPRKRKHAVRFWKERRKRRTKPYFVDCEVGRERGVLVGCEVGKRMRSWSEVGWVVCREVGEARRFGVGMGRRCGGVGGLCGTG